MNFIPCFIKYAGAALLLPQFPIEEKHKATKVRARQD